MNHHWTQKVNRVNDKRGNLREFQLRTHASVVWVRLVLLLPAGILAALTIVTHAFRILDWNFQLYMVFSGLATIFIIGLWIAAVREERKEIEVHDYGVFVGVLAIGLVGVVAASIYNLPNSDDYQYVPNAVHYLTYPDDRMGNEIHYIYREDSSILSVVAATAQPYEYAQALLASLLNVEYLFVYHILMVALVGFAVPLAGFLVASHLSRRSSHAVLAALMVLAVSTLLGETKFSIGNFGLTRLFQGKMVLVAAGLPLFVALSLNYLAQPNLRRWTYLLISATALSGLTASAFFMVPMVALALGLAHLLSTKPDLGGLRNLVVYGLSLGYLVVYGLYASGTVAQFRNVNDPLLAQWPRDFLTHFQDMIDFQRPVTPLAFGSSIILVGILVKDSRRRFLFLWTGFAILMYLNPISGQFWIDHVIGPSIFKRVFFVLPLYPMISLAASGSMERLETIGRRNGVIVFGASILLLVSLHFFPNTTSIYKRGGEIGSFGYKVSGSSLEVARWVVDRLPAGPMLAPPDIAGVTGMLSGGYPQLHLRNRPLLEWLPWDDAQNRQWASYFADGDSNKEEYFRQIVEETDELRIIVLGNDQTLKVAGFLESQGFVNEERIDRYTVYWP